MNRTSTDIYIGSCIENASERFILEAFASYLQSEQIPSVILANLHLIGRQIDFVIAIEDRALLVEAKTSHRSIRGSENGEWQIHLATGEWKNITNPYLQALGAKNALRDAMNQYGSIAPHYYPDATVLFAPDIPVGSSIISGDFKVSILPASAINKDMFKTAGSGWKLSQWHSFAEHHNLTYVPSVAAASNPSIISAQESVSQYCNSYLQYYSPDASRLIPFSCRIQDQTLSSEDIVAKTLNCSSDMLIKGPSGCGKTLLSASIGTNFISDGSIAFTIPAKDFKGSLKEILDRESELLTHSSSKQLLAATRILRKEVLLIIDGYNECSEENRLKLTRCTAGFARNYEARIIVTSQIEIARPDLLNLAPVEVLLPSEELKKTIAMASAKGHLSSNAQILLNCVDSGIEASIIGEVGDVLPPQASRYSIFYSYTRYLLKDLAREGVRALAALAGWFSDHVTFSMSISDYDRFANASNTDAKILDRLFRAKILVLHGERVSFKHELYLNAFAAEAELRKAAGNLDAIIIALNNPLNAERKEMILGALDDDSLLYSVLERIEQPHEIGLCLANACGRKALEWAEAKLPSILMKLKEEVASISFDVSDQDLWGVTVNQGTLKQWNATELAFINSFPILLTQIRHLQDILQIIAEMDAKIESERNRLKEKAKELRIPIYSALFGNVYVIQSPRSLALSRIVSALHCSLLQKECDKKYINIIRDIISWDALTPGQLYLLLLVSQQFYGLDILSATYINRTIERFWRKAPYHLKLDLLEAAGKCWNASEEDRNALIATLDALPNDQNVFISSTLIEVLGRLGALDNAAREQEPIIRDQITQILTDPDNENNCLVARQIYLAQFDHPYSSIYYDLLSELSPEQSIMLSISALKGFNEYEIFLPCLIISVASHNDPEAELLLRRWTVVPPANSFFPQNAVETFACVLISLSRLKLPLCDIPTESTNNAAEVLKACGIIIYWINRIDLDDNIKRSNCYAPLELLLHHATVDAVDAIRLFEEIRMEQTIKLPGKMIATSSIAEAFPDLATQICRLALKEQTSLVGCFRGLSERSCILGYALRTIGNHGISTDLPLLRKYCTDRMIGSHAIKAIKSLEKRIV